jgi:predicted nicotinamide N-methyase
MAPSVHAPERSGSNVTVFQEVMSSQDKENEIALVFFELANADSVGYEIHDTERDDHKNGSSDDNSREDKDTDRAKIEMPSIAMTIVIKQDVKACGEHTGGIVWETAYLLLQYLRNRGTPLGKTLEVGAGCGMLGQVLVAYGLVESIVMTETEPVMPNLIANVERNRKGMANLWKVKNHNQPRLEAYTLDWNHYKEDCLKSQIRPHSMDTILGTDVIFTTKLVEPLLQTLRYLTHEKSEILLCVQERCKDSHKLLLEKAREYDFLVENISDHVTLLPNCEWGADMECRVFKFSIVPSTDDEDASPLQKKKKQRRRS